MDDKILVSIICNAYNHEKYIKSALDGFLMQKTNFKYEVLVHDDASTDGTKSIIEQYTLNYPEIIKPYYQEKNQYSQGIKINLNFHYPRAKGKYIALCEGDDYWIDPLKLQKQVDALENNSNCDVCAHGAYIMEGGKKCGKIDRSRYDTIFPVESVILGGGGFVPTASLIFRKDVLIENPPYKKIISFDYVMQIQGSLRGGMLYLKDIMSVYRRMTETSWTKEMTSNPTKMIEHREKTRKMLECLNEYTHFKYNETIQKRILIEEFSELEAKQDYKLMYDKKYREVYKELSKKRKIKIQIKRLLTFLKRKER